MEHQFGPHRIVVEGDSLFCYVDSALQIKELRQILDLCESLYAQFGSVHMVTMMGPGYDLPPDCRKLVAHWGRDHVLTRNIIVGASFAMRTLIGLINRASKMIGGQSQDVEFAATESEARHIIAKYKEQPAHS